MNLLLVQREVVRSMGKKKVRYLSRLIVDLLSTRSNSSSIDNRKKREDEERGRGKTEVASTAVVS